MAIANRTATTANSGAAAATSLVLNKPTGTAVGDVLLATISVNTGSSITITPPAGWTLINRTNSTTVLGQAVYYRVADGTEGSSFSWGVTSCFISGVLNAYSGAESNNPIAGFSVLAKTTASTSATFGATLPQSETAYAVLCITGRNTTAATTISVASSGYTVDGQACTTATNFIVSAHEDQHTTFTLPLVSVTPGSATFSTTSTDIDLAVFLRPSIAGIQTLQSDVAMFANTLTSPLTTLKFSTGYANEQLVAFVQCDNGATVGGTISVSGTTLVWTRVARSNTVAGGCVDIYTATASSKLAFNSEAFTATPSVAGVCNIAIFSFINCAGVGATNTTSNGAGTPSLALTTTKPNSWIWASVFNDTNGTAPTLGGSQTLVQDALSGEGEWVWRETATTLAASTSVTLNVTAPTAIEFLMAMAEILHAEPIAKDVNQGNNTLGGNVQQAINRSNNF